MRLSCLDGSEYVSNAFFMKDGEDLAQQVSVINTGDGVITFAFTQDQEGLFSCRSISNDIISPPAALAGIHLCNLHLKS